jgi:hypothetical protein
MDIPPPLSPESVTAEQIAAWLVSAERQRLDLDRLLTEPLYNTFRDQALMQMSALLAEAIEEVRVLSATLQEDSQVLRARAQRLREQSTALGKRSLRAQQQGCQGGPSPEEIRDAEQPMRDMFKPNGKPLVH